MMPLFDNESIGPFKLKNELVGDSEKIFEIAAGYFGKPSNKHCRWSDPHKGPISVWEWQTDWWLNISHALGEETINISFRWGEVVFDYEREQLNIGWFVHAVKKSWEDWTEDEILSSPEWIVSFAEENGLASQKMHTKMVMLSYQDPEDGLVQRYFKNIPFTTLGDEAFQAWFGVQKK
jgi:hypothetical protein